MRPPSPRVPLIAIFAALAIFGCSKHEPQKGGKSGATRLPDVLSYDETPVGPHDPLVNSIAPALGPWMVLWRHAYPGFSADSLIRVGAVAAFAASYAQPLREVYPPSKEHVAAFRILSARFPDGRYNLIFDGYVYVEMYGDQISISGEPDSAPLLLDLKREVSTRFDFCGTDCRHHWGVWISPTTFVLTGTQNDERSMGIRGRVQVYSLRDSTVTTYVTRPLHSSRAAAYRSAWESWVAMRYHATKQVASRS